MSEGAQGSQRKLARGNGLFASSLVHVVRARIAQRRAENDPFVRPPTVREMLAAEGVMVDENLQPLPGSKSFYDLCKDA